MAKVKATRFPTHYVVGTGEPAHFTMATMVGPDGSRAAMLFGTAEKAQDFQRASAGLEQCQVLRVQLPVFLVYLRDAILKGMRWVMLDPVQGGVCKFTSVL